MARRRQFLSALAGGVTVLAGCSESTDSRTPTDTSARGEADQSREPSRTEPLSIRPGDGQDRFLELTGNVEKDGEPVPVYSVTAETGLSACLQTYVYETYSSFQDREVWNHHERLHVGLGPNTRVENVDLAYGTGYYPTSRPYSATHDDVIAGEETAAGVAVDLPVSGEIQNVSLPYTMVGSSDGYRVNGDGKLVVPYGELVLHYLYRPIYPIDVTTTRSRARFLTQPDVSLTVRDVTVDETENDGLLLRNIAADVTMDSKKPTQYVNLHTNYGGTDSYDYGRDFETEDFTPIDGQGITRVQRDFTVELRSIDQYNFREFYPIDRSNFDVVLGQVAPLASESVPADRFIP